MQITIDRFEENYAIAEYTDAAVPVCGENLPD